MSDDRLRRYREKRDFSVSPEPSGSPEPPGSTGTAGGPARPEAGTGEGGLFVVQKHAARRLHYDVRLEVEGVMASWAVPKGPAYDPKVKRLAVHVEDHPLDYRTFEGTITPGEYGAGSVIVWDAGTFRNLTEKDGRPVAVRDAIEHGHLSVWLEGTKLHGGWSLTRTGREADNWIMVKRRDEYANSDLDIEAEAPASVQTGLTIEEVAADPGADHWSAQRATWQPPMLASLVNAAEWLAPQRPGWVFERKLDGLRCLAVRNGPDVELWSRNHNSFSARFPEVAASVASLAPDNFTLDGELVAHDGRDFVGFGRLQEHGSKLTVVFGVFDLLHLLGRDTRQLPLSDRKRLLRQVIEHGPALQAVDELEGDPTELLADACRQGWEGLIAKRADAPYAGGRSSAWCKLKCSASQELVIGGWTEPRGTRAHLGALLVGYYEDGQLCYAGKVGTGFSDETLDLLARELAPLERADPPFSERIREPGAHWVEPRLVANVAFSEWTRDGRLRHPRFEGLRTDKDAISVVRERPAEG